MPLRFCPLLALPFLLLACGDTAGLDGPLGAADEPLKVCAGPTTLEGIDVSHWDDTIDWDQVKASGRAFAIAKATEGTTYVDPQFSANWAAMKKAGVTRGAYHFFHSNVDPVAEADHFLETMGPLEPGDLPPTLDLEVDDGESGATVTSTAIQWLDRVADKTGMKPILYTGPSFVNDTLGSPAGLDTHALLWVANWGVTCPDVPAPFTSWGFWQYDDKGTVPGIGGEVDLDVFDGTAADLAALTVQAPSSSSASSGAGGAGGASSSSSASGGGEGGSATTTSASSGSDGGHTVHVTGGCSCSLPASDEGLTWRGWTALAALAVAARRSAGARRRKQRSGDA